MEEESNFLQRSKEMREALKQRAMEIEKGITSRSSCDVLDKRIDENIQSSLKYYKNNPNRHSSVQLATLIRESKMKKNVKHQSALKLKDSLKFPELKRLYVPYLAKPIELQLPRLKKVKKIKVLFTGIGPKIRKLNAAYSSLTNR